jgi:small subunit ribosomal protein S6
VLKYELALVVKPVEEDVYKEELEKVQALIARFGGTTDKVDEWGKRRLAYEIRKLTEGYYCFMTFLAEANAPKEIESRLRIAENVLRYLIIKVDY